ncbi:MAG: hypothetical protein ACYS8Z_04240 [Planctomycetota bacterium]|jgi:hypothetical protein
MKCPFERLAGIGVFVLLLLLCHTGRSEVLFEDMGWYRSWDGGDRLGVNEGGHLVWECRKPDQVTARFREPRRISRVGDVVEFKCLWKSSGDVLGRDCREKLRHDDCVICLAGTGDFRMALLDTTKGKQIARDGEGLEADVYRHWRGYQWRFSPHLRPSEPKRWYEPKADGSRESHTNLRFWKRIEPDDKSVLASRKSWSTMGHEPFAGGFDVPQDEFTPLSFRLKRESKDRIAVSITLNGKTFTRIDSDPNNQPEHIDAFAIHMPNARPYDQVVLAPIKSDKKAFDSRRMPQRVLFIGNSYTYQNDLPGVLRQLVNSSKPPSKFVADKITRGGYTLEAHFKDSAVMEKIRQGTWDFVILQEQSLRPIQDPKRMYEFARKLDAEIRKSGAETVLFMTWARRNKPQMTAGLSAVYNHIGEQLNASVAPVGLAWAKAVRERPDIVLYRSDNSHPTVRGTYLAACVFYSTLTGQSPKDLPDTTQGISHQNARVLRRIAWETVAEQRKKVIR